MAISEIVKNKKYKIVVHLGYNGKKKIRHTEVFCGGKKEAIMRENEIKLQRQNNTFVRRNNLTMQELIEEWKEYKKEKVGIKTFKNYEYHSSNICEMIGHIKLKNLNVKLLEKFYIELKNNTSLSDRTIKDHYTTMSNILNRAVKWGVNSKIRMYKKWNLKMYIDKFQKYILFCYTF